MTSTMVYQLKEGARLKAGATPDVVGGALEILRTENDGNLTPEVVVTAAQKKRHPLHTQFVWDDTKAAKAWRLNEARYLIRSIVVQIVGEETEEPVRAFVKVGTETTPNYTAMHVAMSDTEMRDIVLKRAHKELLDWSKRYSNMIEFAGIIQFIKNLKL